MQKCIPWFILGQKAISCMNSLKGSDLVEIGVLQGKGTKAQQRERYDKGSRKSEFKCPKCKRRNIDESGKSHGWLRCRWCGPFQLKK